MSILLGLFLMITIFAGMTLGIASVGIPPSKSIVKLIGCIIGAVALYESAVFFGFVIDTGFIYVLLLPALRYVVRLPVLQSCFAILFGWTYHVVIVFLVERNLFELAMTQAGLVTDPFIELIIELFIVMNNLLVILWVFRMKPVILPKEAFKREVVTEKVALTHKSTLLVSALLLLVMGIFFQYTYAERAVFTAAYRLFITGWSLLLLLILLYYLKTSLSQKMKQEKFYLDQQYEQDMLSFFTVIRSQRHDFMFHLTSVYGLLKKEEYQEAKEYIGQVVERVQEVNELLPLAHPAMSALLNTQSELAKQKGIQIHYSIFDDLRTIPISVYDVNKILGNLIQNAIEELESLPAEYRELRVEITKEKRHFVIRIANRTEADENRILSMFESGYSSKTGHEGIGLAGVRKIVDANFGVIYPELSGEWLTVHVRIPENTANY